MGKFKKGVKKGLPAISTASLPDVVFLLLIFFMVTTRMRDVSLKVKIKIPEATEIKKLENKSLVSFIYVGEPQRAYQALYGIEPRIQLNDAFATTDEIRDFISSERAQKSESDQKQMFVSLKVDENCRMGIVSDIKQELRKASALKINYSSRKAVAKK